LTLPVANEDFRGEASRMNALLIGYARVSTYEQDLTAQRVALERLGVDPAYIFTDHGLTGTNRARPGLREALAACRDGDTLVVAKLDRLARSLLIHEFRASFWST
jgi:DNA invertase Pin-like site-specific DNA recombinase